MHACVYLCSTSITEHQTRQEYQHQTAGTQGDEATHFLCYRALCLSFSLCLLCSYCAWCFNRFDNDCVSPLSSLLSPPPPSLARPDTRSVNAINCSFCGKFMRSCEITHGKIINEFKIKQMCVRWVISGSTWVCSKILFIYEYEACMSM